MKSGRLDLNQRPPAPEAGQYTNQLLQPTTAFCRTLEGNRASMPEFPDISAALCSKKLTPKLTPGLAMRHPAFQ